MGLHTLLWMPVASCLHTDPPPPSRLRYTFHRVLPDPAPKGLSAFAHHLTQGPGTFYFLYLLVSFSREETWPWLDSGIGCTCRRCSIHVCGVKVQTSATCLQIPQERDGEMTSQMGCRRGPRRFILSPMPCLPTLQSLASCFISLSLSLLTYKMSIKTCAQPTSNCL